MSLIDHKIYFIDDDTTFLDTFSSILHDEGYEVETYTDGRIAIENIKSLDSLPIVITDINMPSLGGLEILKQIREINELIPVIMITGQVDSDAFMEAINNHASYLLMKPFDIDQLIMFLRKAADRISLIIENQRLLTDLSEKNMRLKRYSMLFKNIFDSLNLGVVLLNSDYHVLYFNLECENIFDCLEEDVLKENFLDSHILPKFISDKIRKNITLPTYFFKYRDSHNNHFLVYSLKLDISKESFYLITFENLTRMHELESELTKNAEFIQIGKFSAMIAHEIRNPLTGMKTLCNYIEMNESIDNNEIKEIVTDFNREINRMHSLTDNILKASKNYDDVLIFGSTNVVEKLTGMKRILSGMTKDNIEIDYILSESSDIQSLTAAISPDLFDQIIKNVFKNACETIEESKLTDGKIILKISKTNIKNRNYCIIEIIDNGTGFQKFPDFDTETLYTTKKDGIGFGLTICRKILASSEGYIKFSNNRRGATVRIEIPEFDGKD
ncbi:response regulator [bacterium]|nr:response regulator [bacterium]